MTLTRTQTQTPPGRAEVPAAAPRVLLVDPDREVTAMLLAVMRLRGMTAALAASDRAALAAVGVWRPTVVVMELTLWGPEWSGVAVMRQLHALEPRLPVVLFTAALTPDLVALR